VVGGAVTVAQRVVAVRRGAQGKSLTPSAPAS
jgi:CDP-diacylglycerol---glycerol-3-phosphate 3-phosphatidyltransferase